MRLDHISYACSTTELADTIQRIGSDLCATFVDGGRHPSFGTRNFILPLAGGSYIEVVSALDHPAAQKAPFGRAVARAAEGGGGWFSWVFAVDDMAAVEDRLGRKAAAGHRIRPDGHDLCWRQIGVLDVIDDPSLPFFVDWTSPAADHPSAGGSAVSIARIEVCGDRDNVGRWLAAGQDAPAATVDLTSLEVEWVDGDEPGLVAVWFESPAGLVRID